jgi:hypothetical protein
MSIVIKRGPDSSSYWTGDGEQGEILQFEDCVAFRGRVIVGQGNSTIEFQVARENFEELARKMMGVDQIAAARAFGRALSDGFAQDALEPDAAAWQP